MNLSRTTLPRLMGALAVAVTLAAMGAATALADPPGQPHYYAQIRPDDRGGMRGIDSSSHTTQPTRQLARNVRPDDRSGARGVEPITIVSWTSSGAPGPGFDWRDAGVGAGATLGLILLGGGMVFVSLRRRGRVRPQSA
jgi:hypothetical protein